MHNNQKDFRLDQYYDDRRFSASNKFNPLTCTENHPYGLSPNGIAVFVIYIRLSLPTLPLNLSVSMTISGQRERKEDITITSFRWFVY